MFHCRPQASKVLEHDLRLFHILHSNLEEALSLHIDLKPG